MFIFIDTPIYDIFPQLPVTNVGGTITGPHFVCVSVKSRNHRPHASPGGLRARAGCLDKLAEVEMYLGVD